MCASRVFCLAPCAGSLRLAVLKDQEEERRELEEMKRLEEKDIMNYWGTEKQNEPFPHLDKTGVYLF